MARLHGFPDWFRFNETKWHGARQIGNAVPPPMARAIAASVMAALETKPSRSNGILELGNPRLLAMNMASASRYFEIDVPIKGRDRKSGTKKRKQTPRDEAEAALHSKAGYLNFAGAISV
jgi:DNA (cytosine-5)-methyltransferase 1